MAQRCHCYPKCSNKVCANSPADTGAVIIRSTPTAVSRRSNSRKAQHRCSSSTRSGATRRPLPAHSEDGFGNRPAACSAGGVLAKVRDPLQPGFEVVCAQGAGDRLSRRGCTHDVAPGEDGAGHAQPAPAGSAQLPAAGLAASTRQAAALRRRNHNSPPATSSDAPSPAPAARTAPLTAGHCKSFSDMIPAADTPAISGMARGIAQHAAQAPATPNTPITGFFMLILLCVPGSIPVH